jgi:phosphate-selective porin OprO and OprP
MKRHQGVILFWLLLSLAAAASLIAQEAFYAEGRRDGRIYVFSDAGLYAQWSRGEAVTMELVRERSGPAGETVEFDSERALQLFEARHARLAEVTDRPTTRQPASFGWKDGRTTLTTESSELVLSNRVQVRFTHEDPDGGEERGSFRIRRAVTKLDGWIYNRNVTYELQVDWTSTASPLLDANVAYTFGPGLTVKGGQFKVPFARQQIVSSGAQQFVDRSIVTTAFAPGRDIGVQFSGHAAGKRIEWRSGIFNGGGINRTVNDNGEFLYVARVMYQPWGDVRYSEGDFERTGRPLLAIGAALENNDLRGSTAGNDIDRTTLSTDLTLRYRGLFAFAEYFARGNTPEVGTDFDSSGIQLQAGYFIIPGRFELAGRWGRVDPSDLLPNDSRIETAVAASWYFNRHLAKIQGDVRQIENQLTGRDDREARLQLQLVF